MHTQILFRIRRQAESVALQFVVKNFPVKICDKIVCHCRQEFKQFFLSKNGAAAGAKKHVPQTRQILKNKFEGKHEAVFKITFDNFISPTKYVTGKYMYNFT